MTKEREPSLAERISQLEKRPYNPKVGLEVDSLSGKIRESDLSDEEKNSLIKRLNAILQSKGKGGIEFF